MIKHKTFYVCIANEHSILEDYSKITDPIIFLSRINYTNCSIADLVSFIKNHTFLSGVEDFKFAAKNGKKSKFAILCNLIVKNKPYHEMIMENDTKYLITNTVVLPGEQLADITPRTEIGWQTNYDGSLGYVIGQHHTPEEILYYKYATSINHTHLQLIDGISTHTTVRL